MNLLFLAIDTLRSDHLGCYGYPRQVSPNIDALAARGVVFETFYGVGNCTHPGFTAMFTGLFPEASRIVSHWTRVSLSADVPMMAEYFAGKGFRTAAVDNLADGWIPQGFPEYPWFRRGYAFYDYTRAPGFYQPASPVTEIAVQWLRSHAGESRGAPFLLLVHYWNPHAPYNKAPREFYRFYDGQDPCDPRLDTLPAVVRDGQRRIFEKPITDPAYVVAAYDAEILYTDHAIGRLLEELGSLGLAEDTVVLITADHGEIMDTMRLACGRPFGFSHIGLSEDVLRIPFIVAGGPVARGIRVAERAQLVDILPTLIELFGLTPGIPLDGVSLAPALRGGRIPGREPIYASENTYQKQRAVLRWPWKYTRFEERYLSMPPAGLYHLQEDPEELVNRADSEPQIRRELDALIGDYVRRSARNGHDPLIEQPITHPGVVFGSAQKP